MSKEVCELYSITNCYFAVLVVVSTENAGELIYFLVSECMSNSSTVTYVY